MNSTYQASKVLKLAHRYRLPVELYFGEKNTQEPPFCIIVHTNIYEKWWLVNLICHIFRSKNVHAGGGGGSGASGAYMSVQTPFVIRTPQRAYLNIYVGQLKNKTRGQRTEEDVKSFFRI